MLDMAKNPLKSIFIYLFYFQPVMDKQEISNKVGMHWLEIKINIDEITVSISNHKSDKKRYLLF